jgi:chromosome partitioning protein
MNVPFNQIQDNRILGMPNPPMKIIALAQGKGGATKSTTAIHLACEAIHAGESSAIIDMDEGQQSAAKWSARRGKPTPKVVVTGPFKLKKEIETLREEGIRWLFIDSPGRDAPSATAGVAVSNFVIIPTRPTTIDFEASVTMVQSAVRAKKPYVYLVSAVQPQGNKSRGRQFQAALELLKAPVCPVLIGQRVEIADAIAAGKSVREEKPGGEAAKEFEELFKWLRGKVR